MNTALIIDDDELDLELYTILLGDEGFEVRTTADGPQGITLYQVHHPSVVFLDLGLPSLGGIEVLRHIRAYDPEAKVIIVTGYASAETAVAALKAGALDVIEKSGDVQEMLKRIRTALHSTGRISTP